MKKITLTVQARTKDRTPRDLRRDSIVPCVLYGNDIENTTLQCDHNILLKTYTEAGESTLVELDANGKTVPVLFHAVDFDPVSDRLVHVDFYAVNMKKEVEAHVPVHFLGEAPAVKDLGGIFVPTLDHVWVKCLPADLPHELNVDISSLKEFGDQVTVGDIQVPERVSINEDAELVLGSVQEPRAAEPEPTAPAEGEGGEEAEGKEEEKAEGAEGDKEE